MSSPFFIFTLDNLYPYGYNVTVINLYPHRYERKFFMKTIEKILEWGGTKRDIAFLIISGVALFLDIFKIIPLPFNSAWVAIILCGLPIILEAIVGLVTEFDIKADVLVSLALIASVIIGEYFAAGEVAFIMQLV